MYLNWITGTQTGRIVNSAVSPNPEWELPLATTALPQATTAPKRRGRARAVVLILVHVVILVHVAHFVLNGRSLSPVEPSESMYAIELGYMNAGTIFFGLAILATAVFGRFFCGWACHIVALQDLCSHILKSCGLKVRPLRSRMLRFVPWAVAFYMFVWPTARRMWLQQQHPGFTNHLLTDDLWATFPGPGIAVLTLAVSGGLAVYLLGNKAFCNYVCPYGAIFSVADRVAPGRIRATDVCTQCGHCTAACTSNVLVHKEVKDFGAIIDTNCMKCLDCVSVCPTDALSYSLSLAADQRGTKAIKRQPGRRYDFSWPEDVFALLVASATLYALRGLYDGPPLLLAMAAGVITALLAVTVGRLFYRCDVRLQRFTLRAGGRLTTAGYVCAVMTVAWCAFLAHSFVVQYHRDNGLNALYRVQINWSELTPGHSWLSRLSAREDELLRTARASLQLSDDLGVVDVFDVKLGLSLIAVVQGEKIRGEQYLRDAVRLEPDSLAREMLMEHLVATDRADEAAKLLDRSN